MHPEADAFLDAIFDNPDDDTPRLVYADWLQEHGQENYAQFIRLQCAATHEKLWSDEANRLWEEIGRVWNRLDEEWRLAVRDEWQVGEAAINVLDAIHFERGFLRSDVCVTAGQLARYGHCWAWLPTPETQLDVKPECSALATLAGLSQLARVRHVRCEGAVDEHLLGYFPAPHNGLATLLRSPHLRSVRELNLSMHRLTPDELEVLLTAPNLATVISLAVTLDPQDWSRLSGGCLPQQQEAARKLRRRFANVQCYFE